MAFLGLYAQGSDRARIKALQAVIKLIRLFSRKDVTETPGPRAAEDSQAHLQPPRKTRGKFNLAIALIGPDDKVIAEAETLLAIAPAPAPLEPVVAEGSDATAALPGGEAACHWTL